MTTSVPVPVPPAPYAGTVNPPPVAVTVPDGGPFDAAYKAAGWTPPTPPPPAGLDELPAARAPSGLARVVPRSAPPIPSPR